MFDKVIKLTVNKRVCGENLEQQRFRALLYRLRNGDSSKDDWQLLLTRQPTKVARLLDFENST